MAKSHDGSPLDEELEDDWLAILLEGPPLAGTMLAAASKPEGSAARARSRSRDRAERSHVPPPAANTAWTDVLQVSGAEEEEWQHLPLNVIESNPEDEEAFEQRQQRARALAKLAQEQAAYKRDAVQQSWSVKPSSWSQAAAAASRVCAQEFGNSNSVFHFGAMMSYFLRGPVYSHSAASSLAEDLPDHLRSIAMAQLTELARDPAVKLCPTSYSGVVREVEARVAHELGVRPGAEFYIGITERPRARLADHQANGFKSFWLYVFPSSRQSGPAEVALIKTLRARPQCLNVGAGNERASSGQPHYLYVAWKPAGQGTVRRAPAL